MVPSCHLRLASQGGPALVVVYVRGIGIVAADRARADRDRQRLASLVLAGTFLVLTVLPLVSLVQPGILVAFGVLLDTFTVRSVVVPALVLDAVPRTWWPSRLGRM